MNRKVLGLLCIACCRKKQTGNKNSGNNEFSERSSYLKTDFLTTTVTIDFVNV